MPRGYGRRRAQRHDLDRPAASRPACTPVVVPRPVHRVSIRDPLAEPTGGHRRSWSTVCARIGRAPPGVLGAAVEPGRLTTGSLRRPRPARGRARPRGSCRAVRPDRLRDAGDLEVQQPARGLGVRSVGVTPVPPLVSTTSIRSAMATRSASAKGRRPAPPGSVFDVTDESAQAARAGVHGVA